MSTSRKKSKASPEKLYSDVARKILSDSLHIKKGESVTIETWSNSLRLARQIIIEARKIGAIPLLMLEDEEAFVDGIRICPKKSWAQWENMSPIYLPELMPTFSFLVHRWEPIIQN